MKIVINKCYGGFGLSPLAFKRLAKLQGKQVYFYVPIDDSDDYFKVNNIDDIKDSIYFYPVTKDLGHIASENDVFNYIFKTPERNDSLLVRVIEELGDKANGEYAELKIVEIPDDVDWIIEEYDGVEWVSERHRTWR
jgi:hypothetical protein